MGANFKWSNKARVTGVMVTIEDGDAQGQTFMPIADFAKLFTWHKTYVSGPGGGAIIGERNDIAVIESAWPTGSATKP